MRREGRTDGQTDKQANGKTDVVNLIVTFRNFAAATIHRKQGRQGKKTKMRGRIGNKHYMKAKYGDVIKGKEVQECRKLRLRKYRLEGMNKQKKRERMTSNKQKEI